MPWRDFSSRSAFRIAVLYSALFTGSALVLMGLLYWRTAGTLSREVDVAIAAEMQSLIDRHRAASVPGLIELIQERIVERPTNGEVYVLADANGRSLAGNLGYWPVGSVDAGGWTDFDLGADPQGGGLLRRGRGRVVDLGGSHRLLVARDMLEIDALQQRTLSALGRALAVTVLLALVGAFLVGRSAGRRVEALTGAIDEIMAGDLARRLPLAGAGDEMDQLVRTVNGMLDRIQELMAGVRQVSDAIAHDLRTPLARLQRRLEEALATPGCAEQGRVLEAAAGEASALLATFGALLRISRIEAEGRREGFAEVDASALVADVRELYEPLAEARGLMLRARVEPGARLLGDRDLLFQALTNLLDNAVKYSPDGGRIGVDLGTTNGHVIITVTDRGPGVPAADRERVFQRLVRLDRSRSTPGSGLGLSLVRAVASLHEGRAWIEDAEPGARVSLALPAAKVAPRAAS